MFGTIDRQVNGPSVECIVLVWETHQRARTWWQDVTIVWLANLGRGVSLGDGRRTPCSSRLLKGVDPRVWSSAAAGTLEQQYQAEGTFPIKDWFVLDGRRKSSGFLHLGYRTQDLGRKKRDRALPSGPAVTVISPPFARRDERPPFAR